MAVASLQMPIADLRRWLVRMESRGRAPAALLPFEIAEVDAHLPGGGLPLGHLHEVIGGGAAIEYAGVATLFAAGIVARLAGPVLWCLRGRDLFAPALARIGLHPDRVIYCETWKDRDVLPAMEEGLKCRGLAAVVGDRAPDVASVLQSEMERARVFPAEAIPAAVVRMGSTVEFSADTGQQRKVTLVFPGDADIAAGRISILTPIGAALIGLSPGQSIAWMARDGRRHQLTVLSVEPPAADG